MTNPDNCIVKCGDSKMFAPYEVCDDGTNDNVGCGTNCLSVNPLWVCTSGDLSTPSSCGPKCYDGVKVGFETCDPGPPFIDGWYCNSTCNGPFAGWSCNTATPTVCTEIPNDGK